MDAPEPNFADKTVWVTGASRGLGAAITRAFAAGGATVFATSRNRDALDALAAEPGDIHALPASVEPDGGWTAR